MSSQKSNIDLSQEISSSQEKSNHTLEESDIIELFSVFSQDQTLSTKNIGLPCENIGNSCWLSAIIQSLVHCPLVMSSIDYYTKLNIRLFPPSIIALFDIIILSKCYNSQSNTSLSALVGDEMTIIRKTNEYNSSQSQ